jgi:SAM-dependent methyltransferase
MMRPIVNDRERDDWDRHWNQYAVAVTANPAQSYRRKLIFSVLNLPQTSARVLDIGSGQGDFAVELKAAYPGCDFTGIELSRSGVEQSQRLVPEARFLQRNLLAPVPDTEYRNWATHAVCSEVLEHLDEPVRLLRNAQEYLAPGCLLVVTVPGGPMSAFDRHIGHRTHYTPDSLKRLLESAGFVVTTSFAAGFPFFNLYRLVVLLRGRHLIDDVAQKETAAASDLVQFVMAVFRFLFRFNLTRCRFGWQIVAVARYN